MPTQACPPRCSWLSHNIFKIQNKAKLIDSMRWEDIERWQRTESGWAPRFARAGPLAAYVRLPHLYSEFSCPALPGSGNDEITRNHIVCNSFSSNGNSPCPSMDTTHSQGGGTDDFVLKTVISFKTPQFQGASGCSVRGWGGKCL